MSKNKLKHPEPITYTEEEYMTRHHPHVCPVCNGRGFVMAGFYSSFTGEFSTSAIEQETCRTCNGSGIIWS